MSFRRAIVVTIATLAALAVAAPPASAAELVNEPFTGKVVKNLNVWKAPSTKGKHQPCLTAATADVTGSIPACNAVKDGSQQPDADGQGAMQITNNAMNEAGALLLDQAIGAKRGLRIEFDMFQYNAKLYSNPPRGGDGMSFFLIDGAQAGVQPGNDGGGLAYAGLQGGIVGIGFDEFGNFSNPKCLAAKPNYCGTGGPGLRPNNIVVRGAQATGYAYLKGVASPGPIAVDAAKARTDARRHVVLELNTSNFLDLSVDFNDGKGLQQIFDDLDLDNLEGQPKLPPTLKLGFAASTGQATAYHEIQGFKVATLDPNINIAIAGDTAINAGGTGKVTLTVANAKDAGPTNGVVTATYKVPTGLTAKAAAGDGWQCKISGQTVTCTRDGTFGTGKELAPGTAYSPITIDLVAGPYASGKVTGTATADVRNDTNTADNTATNTITIAGKAKGPDLSVALGGAKTIKAGETGVVSRTISNAPTAGPTNGVVTTTFTAGDARLEAVSASGDGWTCSVSGQTATCTRPGTGPDALQPGASYPPATFELRAIRTHEGGVVPTKGTVSTPGDLNPVNDVAKGSITIIEAPGPDLSVTQTGDTVIHAGDTGQVTLDVGNAPGAGPTEGPVTTTFTADPGLQITGVTGDGWTCKVVGQSVTCVRPGIGPDALPGGSSFPPIKIGLKAPEDSPGGELKTVTKVTTPDDAKPGNDTLTVPVVVMPKPKPAPGQLDVEITSKPSPYRPGQLFTYTVTVANTGKTTVNGAKVTADLPATWEKVGWTCAATAGSTCPAAKGPGDVDALVDLAPGGTVTFTVTCRMPPYEKDTYTAMATVVAENTNCPATQPCKNTDINLSAAARLMSTWAWWIF